MYNDRQRFFSGVQRTHKNKLPVSLSAAKQPSGQRPHGVSRLRIRA
jgi:hypothetical protein